MVERMGALGSPLVLVGREHTRPEDLSERNVA